MSRAAGAAVSTTVLHLASSQPPPIVGTLTMEDRHRGQLAGRRTQAENAKAIRLAWFDAAVDAIVAHYEATGLLMKKRSDIIAALRVFNATSGYTGKKGEQIKRGTIARWLDEDRDAAITARAIEKLRTS